MGITSPLVSVVIPTFNQKAFVCSAVRSCLAQGYRPIEVVVVDDGSSDGTEAAVRQTFGDDVTFIRQANAGTAAARNRGISEARGQAIALLDHDDLFLPQKLEIQTPLLLRQGVGLAYTGMEMFDSASGRTTSVYRPRPELGVHDLLGFETAPPQTFLFWKHLLDDVGGFDPALTATDDWDFSIRVAFKHRVVGLSDPLTRVRGHAENQGSNNGMMYRRCRAVLDKHKHLHPGCRDCQAAFRRARKNMDGWYYEYLRDRSLRAFKGRRFGEAAKFGIHAAVLKPRHLMKALVKAFDIGELKHRVSNVKV